MKSRINIRKRIRNKSFRIHNNDNLVLLGSREEVVFTYSLPEQYAELRDMVKSFKISMDASEGTYCNEGLGGPAHELLFFTDLDPSFLLAKQ